MIDCREQLVSMLKDKYSEQHNGEQCNIKLPSYIDFSVPNTSLSTITIFLRSLGDTGKVAAEDNMQNDPAAFEGWSLVLKSWINEVDAVRLKWDEPANKRKNGHYQRFLYRVHKFQELYEWFSVDQDYKADMWIRPDSTYIVNLPTQPRDEGETSDGVSERDIEKKFVKHKGLKDESGMDIIGNQLPVGVFDGAVTDDTSIFTGGSSAVDLWGVKKNHDMMSIFELKKPENPKVGALSELFFYAMVVRDIAEGSFVFMDGDPVVGVKPWPPDHITTKIKIIKAYLLVPDLHPLLDDDGSISCVMNDMCQQRHTQVFFSRIMYKLGPNQQPIIES